MDKRTMQLGALAALTLVSAVPAVRAADGVLPAGNGAVYAAEPQTEAVRDLAGDETWKPESEHYPKLTLNTAGHTLTIDGALNADTLILKGGGSIVFTDSASAKTPHVIANDSVTIPQKLLLATDHLEIAKDKTVTFIGETDTNWNGRATGPVTAGDVQPGGKLRKEGAGCLQIVGLSGRTYDLDRVTLEIAGGYLRTKYDSRMFCARGTTLRFVEKAKAPKGNIWAHLDNVTSADPIHVYVGEGVPPVRCSAWMEAGIEKSGPGSFEFAPYKSSATITDGLWQMTVEGDSKDGERVTLKAGAFALCKTGNSFGTPLTFEEGSGIIYKGTPFSLTSRAAVTAKKPVLVRGLPETPKEGILILKTAQSNIPMAIDDPAYRNYLIQYSSEKKGYVTARKKEVVRDLTGDETWKPDSAPYTKLTLNTAGHTLTIDGALSANTLILNGGGAIVFTGNASAKTPHVIAKDSVTIPQKLLLATDHLEIAPKAIVTFTGETNTDWNGRATGPVIAGGGIQPGGKLRKEGAGRLQIVGLNSRLYDLDHVTLEIAGGYLRTQESSRRFCVRGTSIRFVENAKAPDKTNIWDHSGNVTGYDTIHVYVGEGLNVFCNAWMDNYLAKSGPGTFEFAPLNHLATIEDGPWQMSTTGNSGSGSSVTLKKGAFALCKPGNSFGTPLTFEEGSGIIYTAGAPFSLTASVTALTPVLVKGLPAPDKPLDGTNLVHTTQSNIDFALPAGYEAYGVRYDSSTHYYKIYQRKDATVAPEADGSWTPITDRYDTLTLNLGGKHLTLDGNLTADRVVVSGSGTLTLKDGFTAKIDRLQANAPVTVSPGIFAGTAWLEIAPGATVTLHEDLPDPETTGTSRAWSGRITGPLTNGAIQPGGTFRKEGTRGLNLNAKNGTPSLSHVTLEIAGGRLGTCADTQKRFRADACSFRFVEAADDTWAYTGSKVISLEGGSSVYVGEGRNVRCNSWVEGAVTKHGPGRLELCMKSGFKARVEEGPWVLTNEGDSQSGATLTVGPNGSIAGRRDSKGTFQSKIEFEKDAKVFWSATAPMRVSGAITANGPIGVLGLPETPAAGPELLKTPKTGLSFELPAAYGKAGYGTVYGNGGYTTAPIFPEGAQSVLKSSLQTALDEALKQAGAEKKSSVAYRVTTNGSTAANAVAAAEAVTVFKNVASAQNDADRTTMTVTYEFGIGAMKPLTVDGQLYLLLEARLEGQVGRAVAAYAEGTALKVFANGVDLEAEECNAAGEPTAVAAETDAAGTTRCLRFPYANLAAQESDGKPANITLKVVKTAP